MTVCVLGDKLARLLSGTSSSCSWSCADYSPLLEKHMVLPASVTSSVTSVTQCRLARQLHGLSVFPAGLKLLPLSVTLLSLLCWQKAGGLSRILLLTFLVN